MGRGANSMRALSKTEYSASRCCISLAWMLLWLFPSMTCPQSGHQSDIDILLNRWLWCTFRTLDEEAEAEHYWCPHFEYGQWSNSEELRLPLKKAAFRSEIRASTRGIALVRALAKHPMYYTYTLIRHTIKRSAPYFVFNSNMTWSWDPKHCCHKQTILYAIWINVLLLATQQQPPPLAFSFMVVTPRARVPWNTRLV